MTKVLYIEDNFDNRMLVRRVLMAEDDPFTVIESDNAQDGIALALRERPHVILMDLSMPDMDGLTATHTIRAIPELSAIPIIALTANAMQGDKERSLAAGCDGYISKPINIDTLAHQIKSFLVR